MQVPNSSSHVPSIAVLLQDESGQDLIEYALVALSIATAGVGAMNGIATKIASGIQSFSQALSNL